MTEFRCPVEFLRVGDVRQSGKPTVTRDVVLVADLPALCRAEAAMMAEFLAAKAVSGGPRIGPNGWARVYLADRFGFPEAAPEPEILPCFYPGCTLTTPHAHGKDKGLRYAVTPSAGERDKTCGMEVDAGVSGSLKETTGLRYFVCHLPKGHSGKHAPWQDCPPSPRRPDFWQSFDARDWAAAFVEIVRKNHNIEIDESLMTGWFANALMVGFDEHARRQKTEPLAWCDRCDGTGTVEGFGLCPQCKGDGAVRACVPTPNEGERVTPKTQEVTQHTAPVWRGCWRHGGEVRIGCDLCKQEELKRVPTPSAGETKGPDLLWDTSIAQNSPGREPFFYGVKHRRPGVAGEPEREYCLEPNGDFVCTLHPDHSGNHKASDGVRVVKEWPAVGARPEVCGETERARPYGPHTDYACSRPAEHPGTHRSPNGSEWETKSYTPPCTACACETCKAREEFVNSIADALGRNDNRSLSHRLETYGGALLVEAARRVTA